MTIPSETIDQIRLATDIVEVIKEYVPGLKRTGRNWKANCPFHNEKTPSFMVSAEKGIYHCFGCHSGGDAFKFLMQIDNITWPEAVRKLALKAGITIIETHEEFQKRSDRQKIYDLLESAAKFYNRCLKSQDSSSAMKYLKNRGVSDESIDFFQLGYAPRGMLSAAALKKGFTYEDLMKAGLITKTSSGKYFEYMSERLVFPIFDTQGHVIAFGGRTLKDDQPKYLNTPDSPVYSKSRELYGLFQALPALRKSREIIIAEGYMDVVVTQQFGLSNTVATLGTALTREHARILDRYAENVLLLFDSDEAGNQAAARALDVILESELTIQVAFLPEGVDPDEYIIEHKKDGFQNYLDTEAKSSLDFLIDYFSHKFKTKTPEAKSKIVKELLPYVQKIKDGVQKSEWLKIISEKLSINERAAFDELRKFQVAGLSRAENRKEAVPETPKVLKSAEEEILQIAVSCPELVSKVSGVTFRDQRCKNLLFALSKSANPSEILSILQDEDKDWFTELMLEEKSYQNPEEVLMQLLKELKNREQELKRQEIEKEVVMMINGQIPLNPKKVEFYFELNKELKGSVKS